jgi:hypothetical protein
MWPKTDDEQFDGERMFGYGPETEISEPKPAPEVSPEQRLLDWLQRWPKETLSMRDILVHGPRPLRARKVAIRSAEVLVKNGWLVPLVARRHDTHQWRVVRKPIIHPLATTVAATVATTVAM